MQSSAFDKEMSWQKELTVTYEFKANNNKKVC